MGVGLQPDWKEWALDLLFPRVCVGCLLDLPPPLTGPLCGSCLKRIKPMEGPLCLKCGVSLDRAPSHRNRCPEPLRVLERIRAAFPYKYPLPALIHAFKYRSRHDAGKSLAGWMAGASAELWELSDFDAVVAVPLHRKRFKQRGFNQAEVLAQTVAQTKGISVLHALERTRNTLPQWKLSRHQRVQNLQDAFQPAADADIRGKRILLIDDICTTGGTLEGCARALRKAGAAGVSAFVLTRD